MTDAKLKLMTILGTRPEIIRLSAVIKRADQIFDHALVHTGQNWDAKLSDVFFQELGLRPPDFNLGAGQKGLGDMIGEIISKSFTLLSDAKPDAVLVLGDTNSALATLAAKRLKIPVFHMEAGNRCFDMNVPEEINRKLVDSLSDVNLPYSENSRRNLLREGQHPNRVFVTGSPMPEVIANHRASIESSKALEQLGLEKNEYLLLSLHRQENVDDLAKLRRNLAAIGSVASELDLKVIFSVHPRTKERLKGIDYDFEHKESFVFSEPFGFFDYMNLQLNAKAVLSDSGTLSEESCYLRFPAVSIRNSTERQEAMERGMVVLGGLNSDSIRTGLQIALSTDTSEESQRNFLPEDYRDHDVSEKVVRIIASYTPLVNEFDWRRQP